MGLQALSQAPNALPALNDAAPPVQTMNDDDPGDLESKKKGLAGAGEELKQIT